jgi:hypothetical protein
MQPVCLLINSVLYHMDAYLTPQGLKGNLQGVLDLAGVGGIIHNFPQAKDPLYGLVACAPEAPGCPRFWMTFADFRHPDAHQLRPLSWGRQWRMMSVLTAAQYAQFRLRDVLEDEVSEWESWDVATRYASLEEEMGELFWARFVAGVSPIHDWKMGGEDGSTGTHAELSSFIVTFSDGSQLVCGDKQVWPEVVHLGSIRHVENDADTGDVVQEIVYPLQNIGRA